MEIAIHCDQTDCKFNTTENIHPHMLTISTIFYGKCTNPRPVIVTTFGKSLSSNARKCHSKSIKGE